MPQIASSIMVNRPLAEVYAFVVNPDNYSQWRQDVSAAGFETGTSIQEGTTIRQLAELNGRAVEFVYKVARLEPNREVVFEPVGGPANGVTKLTQRFAAEDNGTRISCRANVTDAAAKASPGAQQQALDIDIANLKRVLEA